MAHNHKPTGHIGIAFFLNLCFTVIEIAGGIWTNSISILADAVHDLGDSIALGLSWYLQGLAQKKSSADYTFGLGRLSLLAALINIVILSLGSIWVITSAIPRLWTPQVTFTPGMMTLAFLGIIMNGLAAWQMRSGHSHNEKMINFHLLEDILGWVAVLIGSIIIYFTEWYIIDPLMSIGISLFILYNVIRQSRGVFRIILEGSPNELDINKLKSDLNELSRPFSITDMHIWSIDEDQHIMTIHLVTKDEVQPSQLAAIKQEIRLLAKSFGIEHCTIEFSLSDDEHVHCHFHQAIDKHNQCDHAHGH